VKLLVFSSLFPNVTERHHGVFVKNRLEHYLDRHGGSATVVAPVPLAPPVGPRRWTRWRDVPRHEHVDGLSVFHPRYLAPPGFGDKWRARLMAAGVRSCLLERTRAIGPHVLDAHYAYPDGVAAFRLRETLSAALGRRLPLVLTCRGTDLNLLPKLPSVRPQIAEALRGADHVVCVAEALRAVALELGVPADRVTTLRNGVDTELFSPGDRATARRHVGLDADARIVLCVGHLIERKGQHHLLEAFAREYGASPEPCRLVLVGQGEARESLARKAVELGVDHRVVFAGAVRHEDLVEWYRAADVLVLASSREGWPNVVLEALACGTPVVATRVWGTPEILGGNPAGLLVDASVDGLAEGLRRHVELDAGAARAWAERHTWEPTVDGMHAIFERVAG